MEQDSISPNDAFAQKILEDIIASIIEEEIFRMERFLNEIK